MRTQSRRRLWFYALASVVVLADQGTKALIRYCFTPEMSWPLWPGVFHLTYVRNRGAAFGLLKHSELAQWLFVAVAGAAIVGFFIYRRQILSGGNLLRVAFALLLGGTVGNLLDRLRFGCVVDFLDFRIWPVFNLADIGITGGVVLFMAHLIYLEIRDLRMARPREAVADDTAENLKSEI